MKLISIKTQDLSGLLLDFAVANIIYGSIKALAFASICKDPDHIEGEPINITRMGESIRGFASWALAENVIAENRICVVYDKGEWLASQFGYTFDNVDEFYFGDTPLEAVMRCFVALKEGNSVKVPYDLVQRASDWYIQLNTEAFLQEHAQLFESDPDADRTPITRIIRGASANATDTMRDEHRSLSEWKGMFNDSITTLLCDHAYPQAVIEFFTSRGIRY